MGKKASGRHKAQYERQKQITAKHKRDQANKRAKTLAKWRALGVKKNGKPVITVEKAAARLIVRAENKVKAKALRKKQWREAQAMANYAGRNDRPRNSFKPQHQED